MRKTVITIFLLSVLSQTFAQVSIGLKTGVNIANVKNIGTSETKPRFGINTGLYTEFGVNDKFNIQGEILYSIKGYKFSSTAVNSEGTVSFKYVSIPLLGKFYADKRLAFLLGPEFSFLTGAVSKFDNSNHDVADNFKSFDLAVDAGIQYYIAKKFGVDLRYSYGFDILSDVILTDQRGTVIGTDRRGCNRVLQAGLFYKFARK